MKINLDHLKQFVKHDYNRLELKEILASIGIEVAEILDINGTDVFEVEITPNRPDWLSHYGIARELYAKDPSLEFHGINPDRKTSSGKSAFDVQVTDIDGCPRYSGAVIRNIKTGESSKQLKKLIESFGLRTVNNIVDISNLVLMTYGHPIHIFDLDRINGDRIIIRNAKKGEKLVLLDGSIAELDGSDLVIADSENPVAVAGVMGGEHSGVTGRTVNIFIESAWFDPSRIRKTSKKLGFKTDSSYLFERGANIAGTSVIVDLTVDLLQKELGMDLEIEKYFDLYPIPKEEQTLVLEKNFPGKFTGIEIREETASEILERLGFGVSDSGESWMVNVPFFRVDIGGKEDLVEEIIRIYGYDKLDSCMPGTVGNPAGMNRKREFLEKLREHFTANGFTEVINYSFHTVKDNSFSDVPENNVLIKNPIGTDYSAMRNLMLPGLMKNIVTNHNNDFRRIALFETGTIFSKEGGKISEVDVAGIVSTGFYSLPNWIDPNGRPYDFFIFKSQILAFLIRTGFSAELIESDDFSGFLKGNAGFEIIVAGSRAGCIGEVHESVLGHYNYEKSVFFCQLDMDILEKNMMEKKFTFWNRYPVSTRDLSFLISREHKYKDIRGVIKKFGPTSLEAYSLTEIYEGKGIPSDKISMLMNFKYRSSEKTLTNEEVNEMHNELAERLSEILGIIRR